MQNVSSTRFPLKPPRNKNSQKRRSDRFLISFFDWISNLSIETLDGTSQNHKTNQQKVTEMTKQNNRKANHSNRARIIRDYGRRLSSFITYNNNNIRQTDRKKREWGKQQNKNKRNQSIFFKSRPPKKCVSQIYFKCVPQKSQTSAPQSSSVRQPIVSMYTYHRRGERER